MSIRRQLVANLTLRLPKAAAPKVRFFFDMSNKNENAVPLPLPKNLSRRNIALSKNFTRGFYRKGRN